MERVQRLIDVGAPSADARTSPILEESDEDFAMLAQGVEEQGICYFNGIAYGNGSFVCSGSGEQLRCEKGVWIREGGCDRGNP